MKHPTKSREELKKNILPRVKVFQILGFEKLSQVFFLLLLVLIIVVSFGGCTSNFIQKTFEKGHQYKRLKKYDLAISQYKRIFQYDPESKEGRKALKHIIELYIENTLRYNEALSTIDILYSLTRNKEERSNILLSKADLLLKKMNQSQRAIKIYSKIIKENPKFEKNPFILLDIGRTYVSQNQFAKGRFVLTKFISQYPNHEFSPRAHLLIANSYYVENAINSALTKYNEVLALYPHSKYAVEAKFGIGNCFSQKEKLTKALKVYESIVEEYPNKKVIETKIQRIARRKKLRQR